MNICIIVAIAENNAIGFENKLIYWLPNDLKRFKALTTGHTIIMGRKTFESLPKGALPNRRNIVLSRQEINFPGAECFPSLKDALESCCTDEEVFIIGGASVYQETMNIANFILPILKIRLNKQTLISPLSTNIFGKKQVEKLILQMKSISTHTSSSITNESDNYNSFSNNLSGIGI